MADYPSDLGLRFDPRLTGYAELEELRFEVERLMAAVSWKAGLPNDFPVIVSLFGGTGTGKSAIFNSLAGEVISQVGIRRPCTLQGVIYVHEDWADSLTKCPLLKAATAIPDVANEGDTIAEAPVQVVRRRSAELKDIILADTPDFDSVETANRLIAEDFFIISDALVFVTSQEKYGDLSGLEMREEARKWGKKTTHVMNKVVSDAAFRDFSETIKARHGSAEIIRIERVESFPEIIDGLRERPEFEKTLRSLRHGAGNNSIRVEETNRLKKVTKSRVELLDDRIREQERRVNAVTGQVSSIRAKVAAAMNDELNAVVTRDLEHHVQDRLRTLLKKYDIFFVPRMMVRNAFKKALGFAGKVVFSDSDSSGDRDFEKDARIADLEIARSSARLKPLDTAIDRLNLEIAELLASDSSLADLRDIVQSDIPRWDSATIRERFNESFPGVRDLLEEEFERFRDGLTGLDEVKLYGSYTLWALLLVTAEIAVGGGITILDVLLNTAIFPFIPKWMLHLKVGDLLREIGEKVDARYRQTLNSVLDEQAELYRETFSNLLPDEKIIGELRELELGFLASNLE